MAVELASLGYKIDTGDVRKASHDLDDMAKASGRAEKGAKGLTSAAELAGRALGTISVALFAREAIQLADAWKNLQGQLALVTKGTTELASASKALIDIAQRSRVDLETTVGLYTRLARSTEALGASQAQVRQVTETINKAMIVSGTNATQASGALMQLGQAFASGALRGDELNSVMEGMPRIAKAIADGMGITIGQLRALGAEGKLTGEAVFKALLSQQKVVEDEFAKMPETVGQAMTKVRNSILVMVGALDEATGASKALVDGVSAAGEFVDRFAVAVGAAQAEMAKFNGQGQQMVGLGSALASVFGAVVETLVVMGAQVAFVFNAIFKDIKSLGVQAKALFSGDLQGMMAEAKRRTAEAYAERDATNAFSKAILNRAGATKTATAADSVSAAGLRSVAAAGGDAAKKTKERAKGLSEAERAAKAAAEETGRYVAHLEEERATYSMNSQQLRTYTSLLQIEAALKSGDLTSAKRVAALTDEINALEKVNEELEEYLDKVKKIAGADITPTTEAMQDIADALNEAKDPAQRLLDIFDDLSYAAEGIGRALRSGNFSGIARDFKSLTDGLKGFSKLDFSGKFSAIAGIADGVGQAIGGRGGRALSNAANLGMLGMLGMQVAGPVGAAVGAIVGAISAFLGGKKSNEGAGYDLVTGKFSGNSRTSETEQAVSQAANAIKLGQQALENAGLKLGETINGVVIGTRDLSQIYTSLGKTLTSAVGDPAAAAEAALQQVLTSATFLDATQEKLVRSMQATGKSFDEINASLAEYAAAQGMIKSVNDAILQLTDPQAFDLEMVKRAYADQVKAAETARDAGYLTTTQFDELTAALARLNGLQIDDVMSRYGDDAMEILRGTLQAAYEADAAALQEQASAYRQFADSLKGYSDQIRGAMIDTLSPGQQLGATSRRFQNVASLAAQGDKGALGQFQGAAEAFRAASAQFSPDAATNRRNLAAIQRATQDAYDAAQSQVDYAEQQLAVLQGQVAPILGDIRTNTLTTAQALQAYLAASKAKAGGGDPVQAAVASLAAGGPTAGAADPFNAAAYLAANKDLVKAGFTEEQAAAHYYGTGQYEIAGGFRKRGYAAGTNSASPGWAWVGEEGPELMRFRGGEQVVPNHALNDNGRSAAAIERQNQLLEQQNRLLMENTRQAKKTADLLQRVTRDGESLVTVAA